MTARRTIRDDGLVHRVELGPGYRTLCRTPQPARITDRLEVITCPSCRQMLAALECTQMSLWGDEVPSLDDLR